MIAPAAFRNVVRNPRRAATIGIAVALGVWSLLFLRAFNTGALARLRDITIHARSGHGEVATRGYFNGTFDDPYARWITSGTSTEAKLRAIPGVAQTFPRVSFPALLTNGRVSIGAQGQGIDATREASFFNALNIEQGHALADEPDGIMLGTGLARALDLEPGDTVTVLGTTVHGTTNSTDLVVTGIFHLGNPDFDDHVFRLPIAQAQSFLDTDRVESFALALSDDRDEAWPPVAAAITASLPELEAESYAELDVVNYVHTRDWLASQAGVFELIVEMLVFFGVLNTVAASVFERRQELGNLRANGESRGDVLALVGLEVLFMATGGALAGLAMHLVIARLVLAHGILLPPPSGMTRSFLVILQTEPSAVVHVAFTLLAISFTGALVACVRAVRTPIAESLRAA